jgi:hypothetical protein
MKKISNKTGADSTDAKKDYFEIVRNTPPHLKKKFSMIDFHSMIEELRDQREKKS